MNNTKDAKDQAIREHILKCMGCRNKKAFPEYKPCKNCNPNTLNNYLK